MRALAAAFAAAVAGLGGAGCENRKDEPPPPPREEPPRPPSTSDPRYADKVEALRRLLKAGETAAALKAAEALFDDHRLDAEGMTVIASAYEVASDPKKALEVARAATDKDPNYAPAWIAVGAGERATGGFTAAEEALARALELDPKSRAARFDLAGIAADKGQHDVAAKELTTLVEGDPDDFETRFLLATELLAGKDVAGAKAQLAAIVARYPQHFKAQRTLAALAWADGDYKTAFSRSAIAARIADGDQDVANLMEASFYIVVAAELTCKNGPRPWPPDQMVAVLTRLEKDEGLDGAGSFVDLDEKFGADKNVQERVAKTVAASQGCVRAPAP